MQKEGATYIEIEQLDLIELQELVSENPWYSYARHILLIKMHQMSNEIFRDQLSKSAVFLSSRSALFKKIHNPHPIKKEKIADIKPKKVYVVGGDFFSREEMSEIPKEENMEIKLKTSQHYREEEIPIKKVDYEDLTFYTETLGHIYAQQGYYDKAIEVFSKIILLYPQKSAYFASLIKQIEKYKEK